MDEEYVIAYVRTMYYLDCLMHHIFYCCDDLLGADFRNTS